MTAILIVDDDTASCRTLQLHLQSQGHRVGIAHSVEQGLACQADDPPQLVVLDIRMPGMSGLDGLPRFKQADPRVRVVMITAFHDMESTIEARQRGADDYIHKPIDIDELDAAIDKIGPGYNPDCIVSPAPTHCREVDETYSYSLQVGNNGPFDATSITVTDVLPTGMTYVSATGTSNAFDFADGIGGEVIVQHKGP